MTVKMNDSNIVKTDVNHPPFKVVGVESCGGSDIKPVIDIIKGLGYDGVECVVVTSRHDYIPTEDARMAIIVAVDNGDLVNDIALNYHDTGVLTLGVLGYTDTNTHCFDSVMTDVSLKDFPEIAKTILQPIVTDGYMCYDLDDHFLIFRNSRYFKALIAKGKDVESAVKNMQIAFDSEGVDISKIKYISMCIYFNPQRQAAFKMSETYYLSTMISKVPESTIAIWSVNFDSVMPQDQIRFTMIMTGKDLGSMNDSNCSCCQ